MNRNRKYAKRYAVIILTATADNIISFNDLTAARDLAEKVVQGRAQHAAIIDESNGHTLASFDRKK